MKTQYQVLLHINPVSTTFKALNSRYPNTAAVS